MNDNIEANLSIDTLTERMESRIRAGKSQECVIQKLKEDKCSVIVAIKIIRSVYTISLGEAKNLVESHPAWENERKGAEALHDDFEDVLRNDNPQP